MGQLTFDTIVSEGLLLAGNDSLTSRAEVHLRSWLRSQYAAWPWPFLQRRQSNIAWAADVPSLAVGAGTNITLEVQRLTSLTLHSADKSVARRCVIRPLVEGEPEYRDEDAQNTATNRGVPFSFKTRPDASLWGKWTLYPDVIPDRALLLSVDHVVMPANISSGSTVPIYPNDRTMIQAVAVDALNYMKHANRFDELGVLANMVRDDRIKFGVAPGINDRMGLDPGVFR